MPKAPGVLPLDYRQAGVVASACNLTHEAGGALSSRGSVITWSVQVHPGLYDILCQNKFGAGALTQQ